ncbi:MAG: PilZ domain-containing protein [Planctomycetaceae bacterium]|nr:PilZ domain-containing protein [Planctomycetaceae bacterium]
MNDELDRLILEAQRAKFTERRTEPRHLFVRPVKLFVGSNPVVTAFSKDLSKQGIGIITDLQIAEGTIAVISIHSTTHHPVNVKCELRWIDAYGRGWYLTGWKFLSLAH